MKRLSNFFYYLMLMPLTTAATFLLLLFIWGVFNLEEFRWFISDFIPREVVFWFFMGIIAVVAVFLLYNTTKLVVRSVQKNRDGSIECLVTGIPMYAGVNVLIHFILNSGGFDIILKSLTEVFK